MTKLHKPKLDPEEQATLEAFEEALEAKTIKSIPRVHKKIEEFKLIAKAATLLGN